MHSLSLLHFVMPLHLAIYLAVGCHKSLGMSSHDIKSISNTLEISRDVNPKKVPKQVEFEMTDCHPRFVYATPVSYTL